MLTSEDIQKLVEVFATKQDVDDLKQDVAGLREAVQSLTTSIDQLVKVVSDLRTEYTVVSHQLSRHEKWI